MWSRIFQTFSIHVGMFSGLGPCASAGCTRRCHGQNMTVTETGMYDFIGRKLHKPNNNTFQTAILFTKIRSVGFTLSFQTDSYPQQFADEYSADASPVSPR